MCLVAGSGGPSPPPPPVGNLHRTLGGHLSEASWMLKRGRSLQQDQEAEANKGAALHARGHHAGALAAGHGVTAGACSSSSPSSILGRGVVQVRQGLSS